jgi:transposase
MLGMLGAGAAGLAGAPYLGPWQTVHGRFARWSQDGTFDRLLACAQARAEVDWLVALDSTMVRAHQHTAAKGGSKNADLDAPAAD